MIVHGLFTGGSNPLGCCGRYLAELPAPALVSADVEAITCRERFVVSYDLDLASVRKKWGESNRFQAFIEEWHGMTFVGIDP